ncbi:S1C family serine protease [Jejudonia soesokkakensis]|uniref:S1C family serine protease n=1 Tax=Jejudonia soesokkakensis TaxID=1323432 RepID=A0ABW2MY94_9FLAO
MKQTIRLFIVALVAGAVTLGGYKLFVANDTKIATSSISTDSTNFIPTTYNSTSLAAASNIDFTVAAEKTVNAVVHVKNTTISTQPSNIMEYFYGGGQPRAMVGAGSGVIISPDGYIITNNHVIANASDLEVALNNNQIYKAELIGADPTTDIALIKVDANEELPFVPFGDSDTVKIGEWVLAVGNPFNLNSTVTAGIVSAKARDLNEFDGNPQSFIQTDAAVNRGNSGGALVNTRGELVGINTAITSETGSYVGYAFAVPSNNARKVIEDIMEFGNVQRGILGIQGSNLNSQNAKQWGINETEGVYVAAIEKGSGAERGGLKQNDIITGIDGLKIVKFSDLTGYIGSKRPGDTVDVTVVRNGQKRNVPVTLFKLETYKIEDLGLEVKNANKADLAARGIKNGVKITDALTKDMSDFNLEDSIITEINNISIKDIDDVREIMARRNTNAPIKITFVKKTGEINSFIFR